MEKGGIHRRGWRNERKQSHTCLGRIALQLLEQPGLISGSCAVAWNPPPNNTLLHHMLWSQPQRLCCPVGARMPLHMGCKQNRTCATHQRTQSFVLSGCCWGILVFLGFFNWPITDSHWLSTPTARPLGRGVSTLTLVFPLWWCPNQGGPSA